ncbi:MAG: hypothetical protein V4643_06915 [Bacteroidota bacterium]
MAKTILIPIDFQTASLHTLKVVLENNTNTHIRVVLMYAEYLSDSISDLLFYSHTKVITALNTPEFQEALEILKNRFEASLEKMEIKIFHGVNTNALNNFCKANNIEAIYVPKTYKLKTPNQAFNPIPLLRKTTLPFTEVE